METSKPFSRWYSAILMMAVIFIFSSIPSTSLPSFSYADLFVKKGGHMLGYGLLAISYFYGLGGIPRRTAGENGNIKILFTAPIVLAWIFAVLYALTDEFHQSFVPGRQASLVDIGVDAVGAAGMLWLYHLWQKRKAK